MKVEFDNTSFSLVSENTIDEQALLGFFGMHENKIFKTLMRSNQFHDGGAPTEVRFLRQYEPTSNRP